MDATFIYLAMFFLAIATAINTFFVVRTAKMVETLAPTMGTPAPLSEGAPLPVFSGRATETDALINNASLMGKPGVIVFTDPECPTCDEKKPEILKAQQGAAALGVTFLMAEIRGARDRRTRDNANGLSGFTMELNKKFFYRLNPTQSMPLYIFFDENGVVKASDMVGDENWRLFIQQVSAAPSG